ncbi:MAG: hypothetical protein H7338_12350 [Candidatus Sericytochromatia bacterium]|nr:hypothetical protein [Candidatus Sericytochromatia bacterium]
MHDETPIADLEWLLTAVGKRIAAVESLPDGFAAGLAPTAAQSPDTGPEPATDVKALT